MPSLFPLAQTQLFHLCFIRPRFFQFENTTPPPPHHSLSAQFSSEIAFINPSAPYLPPPLISPNISPNLPLIPDNPPPHLIPHMYSPPSLPYPISNPPPLPHLQPTNQPPNPPPNPPHSSHLSFFSHTHIAVPIRKLNIFLLQLARFCFLKKNHSGEVFSFCVFAFLGLWGFGEVGVFF